MRPEGLREEFHIGWLKINYLAGIPEVRGVPHLRAPPTKWAIHQIIGIAINKRNKIFFQIVRLRDTMSHPFLIII
jgi:hypothetical protein